MTCTAPRCERSSSSSSPCCRDSESRFWHPRRRRRCCCCITLLNPHAGAKKRPRNLGSDEWISKCNRSKEALQHVCRVECAKKVERRVMLLFRHYHWTFISGLLLLLLCGSHFKRWAAEGLRHSHPCLCCPFCLCDRYQFLLASRHKSIGQLDNWIVSFAGVAFAPVGLERRRRR
ncbi:hypothetical protein QBC38DRAFT_475302 [Podospora fimiseda]|uniref:Uncharacterized protein n=1 Tax=Podospora fimiseda TaxID=252190 RepID=A0AAN7BRP3_9PEZI|nr:hypothetical protein QBC38DRAFT_475302 [Podospora fimiseda]